MHVNKFFYGLFVCATLCACSNDDVSENTPDDSPKVFTSDEAYISVRLTDAGSIQSRATTADPGYEYGVADECSVKNAFFYFYDANGVFVSEGSAWNGGAASTTKPAENIELKSNTVVALKGLTKKNYPKYMVTVLNRPAGLSNQQVPQTLAEMEKKLASDTEEGITTQVDGTRYFVMSTTSWTDQESIRPSYEKGKQTYFVTEVKEENFSLEPIAEDYAQITNPVTVYVERLAAKVTLRTNLTADKEGKYYIIKATVAGSDNTGETVAAEELYVELLGWKLNATAKSTNIVKNIDESWTESGLGFAWNKSADYRSFWGKSFNYGKTGYPENAAEAANSEYLNYVNLNSGLLVVNSGFAYCPENTNTSDIVSANFPSAVTSILLKARVCDADGNALDLVRFNGILFNQDAFKKYILNVMKAKNQWNVWTENGGTYTQLSDDYVKLSNVGDGKIKVELDEDKIGNITLYANQGNGNYAAISDKSSINTSLVTESGDAIGYNGGLMYYNIPIEHLNNADATTADGVTTIPEAKYGVVRNHYYVVTINKLEKIGKGIFNPDEIIVPGKDDDKEAYYVGANINILSWKIVSQNVGL